MKMITKCNFYFSAIVLLIVLFFGYLGATQELIIVFVFISIFLSFYSKEKLYLLFYIVFLSNGFLPRTDYIMGMIGIHQTVTLVSLITVLLNRNIKTPYKSLHDNIKYSNKIIIMLAIYVTYVNFKNYYFKIFDTNLINALTTSINFFLMSITIMLIPTRVKNQKSFFVSAVINIMFFFSVSALFSVLFDNFGMYTRIGADVVERAYGFIGNGDSNTLALVMVIGIGRLLTIDKRDVNKSIVALLILLAIASIGASGSRSGLLLLVIVFILYLSSRKNLNTILKRITVVSFLVIISLPFLKPNIERMQRTGDEQAYREGSTDNRIGKWMFYLNYFAENPKSLIRGGNHELELGWDKRFLVAHNFYIQIVYGAGLIMLMYYLYLLWDIYKLKIIYKYKLIMMLIPIIAGLLYISDYGALLFFAIMISSLTGEENRATIGVY